MSERVEAVLRAVASLRDEALVEAVRATGMCEGDAARWCVSSTLDRYTRPALEAREGARWEGRAVRVVLAATVPLAALRAVTLPLLDGAAKVRVRPSSRQRALPLRVVEALAAQGLPITTEDGDADAVIAYGRDETLRALARGLAPEVVFEGRGHGFGAAVLSRDDEERARAFAADVAAYDQRGCLSPQVALCVGDAVAFATRLHHALDALHARWPRGAMALGAAAAQAQWIGAQAAQGAKVLRGEGHVVSVWSRAVMQASPGGRSVAVVQVAGDDEARALLAPHARLLSVVGVCEGDALRWAPEGFAGRVSPLGAMQDPPLDGPEDPRPPWRGAA